MMVLVNSLTADFGSAASRLSEIPLWAIWIKTAAYIFLANFSLGGGPSEIWFNQQR